MNTKMRYMMMKKKNVMACCNVDYDYEDEKMEERQRFKLIEQQI